MEKPEWLLEYNIIIQDITLTSVFVITFMMLVITIVGYPVICMVNNKDDIIQTIKEMFNLLIGKR